MNLANIKLPIAVIAIIVAQAFGIIWYVATLVSTVRGLDSSVIEIQETIDDTSVALEELKTNQAIINNEMRTIMSDHEGFGDVLKELGKAGVLPSGERRSYGEYR